jgi:hypothetical protein
MEPSLQGGGGDSYTRKFERWMKEGSRNWASLCKGFMRKTLREVSFTGKPKDMLRKARKWASASIGAPVLENMEGCFIWGLLIRGIFMRSLRDMQNTL